MAVDKIRFFKMVTPPDGDTKTTVCNKTIAGTSFSTTISAINSLGATVNSIGVALRINQMLAVLGDRSFTIFIARFLSTYSDFLTVFHDAVPASTPSS